ncbi:MAG: LCP family protein [Candidatus Dojkabacteria bacterium]|nr:MAG: LCP family protein [Candidatus Dojkabacteria bacterium]
MVNLNLSDSKTTPKPVAPPEKSNTKITLNGSLQKQNANEVEVRPTVEQKTPNAPQRNKGVKKPLGQSKLFRAAYKMLPLLIFVLSISGIWFSAKQLAKGAGLDLTVIDTISTVTTIGKEPELKKDSTGGYTNILIVGKDTREYSDGLQNTDTIILVSYNYETNDIVMFSIPRDFYAGIPGEKWYVKINSIYNRYEAQTEGTGLPALVTSVEDLLGVEIQYYGMVDLGGFKEVIDIVGGVDVYVDNSFTDYQYPNPKGSNPPYVTVKFTEGPQTMDAETALKYARSRKAQGPEGSDYARARRQQKVINAVMDKVLSSETLLNPDKVLSIAQSLSKNTVISDYSLDEVKAALALADELKASNSYSFVLDPSVGNSKLVKTGVAENIYAIGPRLGLGKYDDIHTYVDLVMENPAFLSEKSIVYVYDVGLGYAATQKVATDLQKQYPFNAIVFAGTLRNDQTENSIFYNNESEKMTATFEVFKQHLNITNTEKPAFVTTKLYNEHVSIMLATDPATASATTESEAQPN